MTATRITELTLVHVDAYMEHMARHALESGKDGDPVFLPWGDEHPLDLDLVRERRRRIWAKPLSDPSWGRAWGVWDDERLVGHVELSGTGLPTAAHRASLGMGLERSWRRRGLGAQLLETALAWARGQDSLDWVDLGVFGANERARRLYRDFGFRGVGDCYDNFRVDGVRVDNVAMTIWVGSGADPLGPVRGG